MEANRPWPPTPHSFPFITHNPPEKSSELSPESCTHNPAYTVELHFSVCISMEIFWASLFPKVITVSKRKWVVLDRLRPKETVRFTSIACSHIYIYISFQDFWIWFTYLFIQCSLSVLLLFMILDLSLLVSLNYAYTAFYHLVWLSWWKGYLNTSI